MDKALQYIEEMKNKWTAEREVKIFDLALEEIAHSNEKYN